MLSENALICSRRRSPLPGFAQAVPEQGRFYFREAPQGRPLHPAELGRRISRGRSRVSMASFLAATEADPHCGSRASRDASSASSIHSSIIIAAPATRAHRKMSLNFGYSFIQRYMEARAGIAGSSQIFRSVSPLARRRHIFSARAGEYRDGRPVFFFPVSVFLCFLLDKI